MTHEPTWQGLLDAAIVTALRAMPAGAELRWNDPTIDARLGYTTGWVAVTMRPLCGLLGIDHACEVFGPEELARGIRPRALDIVMEPDGISVVDLRASIDEVRLVRPLAGPRAVRQQLAELLDDGEFAETVRTVDGISARLFDRIRRLTDRDDLTVIWDPSVVPSYLIGLETAHGARCSTRATPEGAVVDRSAPQCREDAVALVQRADPSPRAAWTPGLVRGPALGRTL